MGNDGRCHYLTEQGTPAECLGTDAEALARARELLLSASDDISHVEAVSVGCPSQISDTPGRLLVWVRARLDGHGWMLQGSMMHGSWHRSISDAVTYGAFRTLGYDSETRITNAQGKVTHVVLISGGQRKLTLY